MGRVVNIDNRDIQVDYWGGVATSLEAGQGITVCSSETMIATTQQLGLLRAAPRLRRLAEQSEPRPDSGKTRCQWSAAVRHAGPIHNHPDDTCRVR